MEAGHGCMEKGILLEYREIFLLLESIGVESVNGICLDQKPVSDEEAVRVLAGMNRKGFLENEGGVFRIEKRTGRILQCMAWPEQDYPMVIEDETYYCYERGAGGAGDVSLPDETEDTGTAPFRQRGI